MIDLTLFKSPYDVETTNKIEFNSFSAFERWLYRLARLPTMKPEKGKPIEPHHAPLISPAIYQTPKSDAKEDKITRLNKTVVKWARWAALDVDDFKGKLEDIDSQGFYSVIYSTASSTEEHLKFRMVFPLTDDVYADDIPDFWYSLNRRMESVGDEQVKDLSRMYYIPGVYPKAFNFIKTIPGEIIDPGLLMRDFPRPVEYKGNDVFSKLPVEMQRELLASRLEGCNRDYKWTSWRDCPFINKELLTEYQAISGTGWYHKLYAIMASIAAKALHMQYMITAEEIAELAAQIHLDTRGWPSKRNLLDEANRALDFAVQHI